MRFLIGPAGSGKTFRCLHEIRRALLTSPEGPALVLLAPKQTTYQLERQILEDPELAGYTRLHILSLERLAYFIFDRLGKAPPRMLDEEGRLMVLRALLSKKRDDLKLFRASARLTGFAQQLSLLLRDLQNNRFTPEVLNQLASRMQGAGALPFKLQDLATLLQEYGDWLRTRDLLDADCLPAAAAGALRDAEDGMGRAESGAPEAGNQGPETSTPPLATSAPPPLGTPHRGLHVSDFWADGFVEWSAQELDLLAALTPHCARATLTFCLESMPRGKTSWLSNWCLAARGFEECRKRFEALPGADLSVEVLKRAPENSRFGKNPVLAHLEKWWEEPKSFAGVCGSQRREDYLEGFNIAAPASKANAGQPTAALPTTPALRVALCVNPEAEATLAAREILRHVRAGGRYREVMVLVRSFEGYHDILQRVFSRYQIPFFLDRREAIAHHPLAELTRSALRAVALGWQHEDWFAALKSGLVPADDEEIDRLENEALARGWTGPAWQRPITIADDPALTEWLAALHQRITPPFQALALDLAAKSSRPTGPQLAAALRRFWQALGVEAQLQTWTRTQSEAAESRGPNSVHATVWQQMNAWVANVELAFTDSLPLRNWLPILEAGLASLTVGVIPPALDQVLLGAVDRSRNPDIKFALVLGMNEGVFPAPSPARCLLSDSDRAELERRNVMLSATTRQHLGRERFLAYVACTRARERLLLTRALHDAEGAPLNPSPFLSHLRQLFPSLAFEQVSATLDWRESEHAIELIGTLIRLQGVDAQARGTRLDTGSDEDQGRWPEGIDSKRQVERQPLPASNRLLERFGTLPGLAAMLEQLRHLREPESQDTLSPELTARLYGPVLRTSVSRVEQFAACPFKFFVHSGLRAEERKTFELDRREAGSFQHDALMLFHQDLQRERKRWRDVTPGEARERLGRIARALVASYREGLMQSSDQGRFMATLLTESLQDFIETLVGWMRTQYQFDPAAVELSFGGGSGSPVCSIDLGNGRLMELQGRVDRIDICPAPDSSEAFCVVVDYKSGFKRLDPVLLAHGLQLQLLAYLNVLRRWPNPRELFGATKLVPAGVFYVSLKGTYARGETRREALAGTDEARKSAYRHTGRFDLRALRLLDARQEALQGDQFKYRLNKGGELDKRFPEGLTTADFEALIDSVEANLKRMGGQVFAGQVKVDPFRRGLLTACDHCAYQAICRIDPWVHAYRMLR